mmetsp:Transcript_57497/g.145772  ORF Transcript_57497/g.145772 Transcript_57497/m.145772 type:complete len:261 (-) Transcript_57497:26-808(-)
MLRADEESLGEDEGVQPQSTSRFGVRTLASALALAGCCAAVALSGRHSASSGVPHAVARIDVVAVQELYGSPTLSPSEELMPPAVTPVLDNYFKEMMGAPSGEAAVGSTAPEGSSSDSCHETEELFMNLCYKTCKTLTNGAFPLRTSAWTCCQASKIQDCFLSNQKRDLGVCSGHDVDGEGHCPHPPGECGPNEELFLGNCYEKCSILTQGQKPYRTTAISCCETHLALSCFSPSHVNTGFAVGGENAAAGQPAAEVPMQ